MPKKAASEDQGSLFLVSAPALPPLLTAVDTQTPNVTRLADARRQKLETGRPGAQRGAPEKPDESDYASRKFRKVRNGRYNPNLLQKIDAELSKQGKDWQYFVDVAMAQFLAMGAPKLDIHASTLLLCSGCGSKDQYKTTTTTTTQRSLPGFDSRWLEMPHKSEHQPETIIAYAESSYRGEIAEFVGVKKPHQWIKKAWFTGEWDAMITAWQNRKGEMERFEAQRSALREANLTADRERIEQIERERKTDNKGKRKWER